MMKLNSVYKPSRVVNATLVAMVMAFVATPATAAIVTTDDVESVADYTHLGTGTAGVSVSAGGFGLPSIAGANFVFLSSGATDAQSGSVTLTDGFGAGVPIAAGTYTLSLFAGNSNLGRDTFTTFDPFLETIGGTELSGANVTTAYVAPAASTFTLVEVEYTVGLGDALIGQEFTWGFDYTKTGTANAFFAGFDAVSVDFVAVPEPSSFALLGLGVFGICVKRRNRRS